MNNLQIGAYEALKEKNGEQNAIISIDYIDSIRGMSEERARNLFVTEDRLTAIFVTKKDLADTRTELKTEIANLRTELKVDIEKSSQTIIKWMIGLMLGIASLVVAVIKLL
jgi:SpoVK/Ycf46/Vps4 family AAA+-type ATPase